VNQNKDTEDTGSAKSQLAPAHSKDQRKAQVEEYHTPVLVSGDDRAGALYRVGIPFTFCFTHIGVANVKSSLGLFLASQKAHCSLTGCTDKHALTTREDDTIPTAA
jgi:hypothetical protein